MEICPMGASCSIWTDRRTDVTKLIVTFCNVAKAPKYRAVIISSVVFRSLTKFLVFDAVYYIFSSYFGPLK
jgi:hypothetical protein